MSTKTARNQRRKKGPVSPKKIAPAQKIATPPHRRMARRRLRLKPGIIAAVIVGVAIIGLGVLFFLNNAGGSSTTNNQPKRSLIVLHSNMGCPFRHWTWLRQMEKPWRSAVASSFHQGFFWMVNRSHMVVPPSADCDVKSNGDSGP